MHQDEPLMSEKEFDKRRRHQRVRRTERRSVNRGETAPEVDAKRSGIWLDGDKGGERGFMGVDTDEADGGDSEDGDSSGEEGASEDEGLVSKVLHCCTGRTAFFTPALFDFALVLDLSPTPPLSQFPPYHMIWYGVLTACRRSADPATLHPHSGGDGTTHLENPLKA